MDSQCSRQLDRAFRTQPEVAAEADEIRRKLALELCELPDLPGLHELPQPGLDARADAAQVAYVARRDQLGDRHREAADGLRRPPIGARGVWVGVAEVEQRREGVEPVGNLAIVHRS